MERVSIKRAQQLFGDNFIGIAELAPLFSKMGLDYQGLNIPDIEYSIETLEKASKDYILILGIPRLENTDISILTFRNIFGTDPDLSEPCFYNQDWYLNEEFINITLELRWYLLKKDAFLAYLKPLMP